MEGSAVNWERPGEAAACSKASIALGRLDPNLLSVDKKRVRTSLAIEGHRCSVAYTESHGFISTNLHRSFGQIIY